MVSFQQLSRRDQINQASHEVPPTNHPTVGSQSFLSSSATSTGTSSSSTPYREVKQDPESAMMIGLERLRLSPGNQAGPSTSSTSKLSNCATAGSSHVEELPGYSISSIFSDSTKTPLTPEALRRLEEQEGEFQARAKTASECCLASAEGEDGERGVGGGWGLRFYEFTEEGHCRFYLGQDGKR